MSLSEVAGLLSIPLTVLSTGAALFLGVALATKKNRMETIKVLKSKDFGDTKFADLANTWVFLFERFFGQSIFAKRQILTIPLYTIAVSGIFFFLWIVYLYIFKNPTYSFSARLPFNVAQAIKDFYTKGIFASLLIDVVTIQMTKLCIKLGRHRGFDSFRFYAMFILTLLVASFLFSIAAFLFRVDDMVRLYLQFAPNDPMPVIPYAPLTYFGPSLSLFQPQTLIHVTSAGWLSTYFMPEPLIFYCGVTAQLSLLFIALAHQIAIGLLKLKTASIRFVSVVGTPAANAGSVIFVVVLSVLALPVLGLVMIALFR